MTGSAAARTATIVMYHVVRPAGGLASTLKGLDVAAFRGQLEHIRAHYSPVSLFDLADAAESGTPLPRQPLVLTFDDGYAVHRQIVLPMLQEMGITAAFFPVASSMLDRRVLDVNKIQLLLSAGRIDAIVAEVDSAIEQQAAVGGPTVLQYRERWWKPSRFDPAEVVYVKRLLQHAMPESPRRQLLDRLFRRLVSADESAVAAELYMTAADVKELRDAGMTIGAHGGLHLRLPTLSPEGQGVEIDSALTVLDAVDLPRRAFAYSYANGEYDQTSIELLRQRGCRVAVTTQPLPAAIDAAALLALPRIDTNDLPERA